MARKKPRKPLKCAICGKSYPKVDRDSPPGTVTWIWEPGQPSPAHWLCRFPIDASPTKP